MIKLKRLDTEAFTTADTFFRSSDAKRITQDYFNYVYTSCLDYIDTGDLNILNRVLVASKMVNRVRMTTQLVTIVSAHKMVAGKYKGKANTKRLTMVRNRQDELKGKQEDIINRDTQKKEAKASTFDPDMAQTRAVNAIAALLAHGIDIDMKELAKLAHQQKDKVKTKSVLPSVADPVAVVPEFEPAH